jgi:1-acyl-sn-glycerol-3-phosphate acyltransferase
LGSFPVRRGASDQDALDTARAVLENGDTLLLFPEGTRVRGEGLGEPKRGAARLAIEANAPLVPVTITGTEKRKWPLPRKVKVTFGTPVPVEGLEATPEDAAALIGSAWPQVAEEYKRWQTRPGTIAVAAAAVGLGILVAKKRSTRNR